MKACIAVLRALGGLVLVLVLLVACSCGSGVSPSPTLGVPSPTSQAPNAAVASATPAPSAIAVASATTLAGTGRATQAAGVPTPLLSATPSTMKVFVYYTRTTASDIEFVQVERTVAKTQAVGKAAIEELLKGPTPEEKAKGLDNPIPPNARLLSLKIVDGVAYADFDEALEFQVGGSLRTMAIRKMITLTLMQFSTVKEVIISIEGRTEDILQP